jgi:hypothetical protein
VQLSSRRAWIGAIGLYALLTLLYGWPLLGRFGSVLPSDIGDPGLNTWILWWNAHARPLTDAWWNAPIFYPMRGALALSETLLGVAPLTTPMQWFGATPVAAHNAAFLLSFFSAAVAAHALARRLTGRHAAGLIAGVAYGFNPYRAAQMPHLQILMSCWMPLALLGLHGYLERRRPRDLALFAVAWLMNGLTTGYFLVYFAVLVGCWVVWFARTWRDRIAIAAAAALASLPLVPLLAGYHRYQTALGVSRGINEITSYSADLSAIWATSPFVWLARHWTLAPQAEGELYPGVVILALTVGGLLAHRRARAADTAPVGESTIRRRARWLLLGASLVVSLTAAASWLAGGWKLSVAGISISLNRPHKAATTAAWLLVFSVLLHPRAAAAWRKRTTALFYPIAACAMFILALGPLPHAFGVPIFYQAPYAALMHLPGGQTLRVPARFAMLVMLCLSQAAAFAFARWRQPNRWGLAAVVLLIALDGWVPQLKTAPAPPRLDLAGTDISTPVLELPMDNLFTDTAAMLRATAHGHPLVNGYSGYETDEYRALRDAMRARDPEALEALRRDAPLLVAIDPSRDADGRVREFISRAPGARLVRAAPAGIVYSLPASR